MEWFAVIVASIHDCELHLHTFPPTKSDRNKLKDDRKVVDGELMDAIVCSHLLLKKGNNCFILPCTKLIPFLSTREKVAQNSASYLQLWSLGVSHCFISSCAGVTVQGRKQISFY